ncbi:MAG: hypothetical protein K2L76_09050 [Muribaculaceae bacterium]|nr:hypothetical protein [Muribaculaceae bacterium]
MFRVFATIAILACALAARAQSLPADSLAYNADVQRFYQGCMKIAEAESLADAELRNSAYAAAMTLLNTRASRNRISLRELPLVLADTAGLVAVGPLKEFAYDYAYARARYRAIDFAPSGITRGGFSGCRVFDMKIAPGASVTGTDRVGGNCILLAIAQPGGSVEFSVDDAPGTVVSGSYEGGMVAFAAWYAGPEHAVTYTVRNTSDRAIVITLASN